MSSYRDGRPWDGGPPGAEQEYSGQQYSAPVPATDPWTGVSYAQYANYDYSTYGHGYNFSYDPTYYQRQDNYYDRNKAYPPQKSHGKSNSRPGGSTSKSYRSRSRSRSQYSRRERSYSRSHGSVDRSRSRSKSRKAKLKRYSRSSSRSYSTSPVKVKKERFTPSPVSTKTLKKQTVFIKKEKKSHSKSRSRSTGTKDDKFSLKDSKTLPSNKNIKQTFIKKERISVSPQKATSSKAKSVSSPKTSEKSKTFKLNKHKCCTPPLKERSVTPPKCYARTRSVSASSRSSWGSSRESRSSRASASRSRSRTPRLTKKAHRRHTVSRSSSRHHTTPSRSRSKSRRRVTKSRSASNSDNARSRSNSRHRSRSNPRRRPGKSRSTSRRRSNRSVSKSRRNSSHSRSRSRSPSRSRSKLPQKLSRTTNLSRRSHSKSRDRRSSSGSRSRSRSDDDERRGQFTVADRKRFWKRHRTRIEDKVRTPPKEVKPPPLPIEVSSVDAIEYGDPPEVEGPNFAEILEPSDQRPSTSKMPTLPIKNDGSFLEMFKKMQEETKKAEEAEKKVEIKKPTLPFIGKRRGGRVLKTGLVKKARAIDEQAADAPKDAWSLYMQEVKKYRETSCEEERKTRPLVK